MKSKYSNEKQIVDENQNNLMNKIWGHLLKLQMRMVFLLMTKTREEYYIKLSSDIQLVSVDKRNNYFIVAE